MKPSKRNTYVALFNLILVIIAIVVVFVVREIDTEVRIKINQSYLNSIVSDAHEVELTTESDDYVKNYTPRDRDSYAGAVRTIYNEVSRPDETDVVDSQLYIELTDDEIRDFATLVYLESGAESYECQCAVASVVINRMTTRGMSLHDVIYERNQFSPAYLVSSTSPSESTLNAVMEVITNGPTIPEYVTFFRADYYFDWATPYTAIDHTYFSYDENVKRGCESD